MGMKRIPKSQSTVPGKGEWAMVTLDGKTEPLLSCPGCGTKSFMSNHEIANDGSVTPSVGCPIDLECYHEVGVVLEGWAPA